MVKVASMSFDVLEIRCDGKSAVGSLTATMRLNGIHFSVAGPCQHVSVIERMAHSVNYQHRCHDELAMTFVMTHTIIVWWMI